MLFAIEDEHGWTFDDSAFPAGFDFDAVIVACILGPDIAGYIADKPQLSSRHCKIYRYLPEGEWDKLAPPKSVNYRTGLDRRLERKTTRVLGDVVSVERIEELRRSRADRGIRVDARPTGHAIPRHHDPLGS